MEESVEVGHIAEVVDEVVQGLEGGVVEVVEGADADVIHLEVVESLPGMRRVRVDVGEEDGELVGVLDEEVLLAVVEVLLGKR